MILVVSKTLDIYLRLSKQMKQQLSSHIRLKSDLVDLSALEALYISQSQLPIELKSYMKLVKNIRLVYILVLVLMWI